MSKYNKKEKDPEVTQEKYQYFFFENV